MRSVTSMVEHEVEYVMSSKRKSAKPPTMRKEILEGLKNAIKLAEQSKEPHQMTHREQKEQRGCEYYPDQSLLTCFFCAGGPRLFLCMKDLSQHIQRMFSTQNEALMFSFVYEYSDLLCDLILPIPSYCQLVSATFFEGENTCIV